VQVADRFHLVKHAGEVLARVVQRHHKGVRSAAKAVDHARGVRSLPDRSVPAGAPEPHAAPGPPSRPLPYARQRRFAQYQDVVARAEQGRGPVRITAQVGLTRQTVARWLKAGTFPERVSGTTGNARDGLRAVSACALTGWVSEQPSTLA